MKGSVDSEAVNVALLGGEGVVVFDSLLEAPAHEVSVDLQCPVDSERKDKCDVEAVETGRA